MMECKKALAEAEGDIDKAVDVLRTRGLAAVRQEGRPCHQRGRRHAALRLRRTARPALWPSSTARPTSWACTDKFKALRRQGRPGCRRAPPSLPTWTPSRPPRSTARPSRPSSPNGIATRWARTRPARPSRAPCHRGRRRLVLLIHMGGKIGVLVAFAVDEAPMTDLQRRVQAATARDVAMQVAAATPDLLPTATRTMPAVGRGPRDGASTRQPGRRVRQARGHPGEDGHSAALEKFYKGAVRDRAGVRQEPRRHHLPVCGGFPRRSATLLR